MHEGSASWWLDKLRKPNHRSKKTWNTELNESKGTGCSLKSFGFVFKVMVISSFRYVNIYIYIYFNAWDKSYNISVSYSLSQWKIHVDWVLLIHFFSTLSSLLSSPTCHPNITKVPWLQFLLHSLHFISVSLMRLWR